MPKRTRSQLSRNSSQARAAKIRRIRESPPERSQRLAEQNQRNSQADDRKMIRLVRERRLLYARNNMPVASYHSQVKRLWQEVANKMGWTVAEVRRKWSHIRNSYSRHLRNEMHGAMTSKGRTVSRWYLADELAFLREHMATDTRPPPFSTSFAPTFLKMDMGEPQTPELAGGSLLQSPWLPYSQARPEIPHDDSSNSAFDPEETSSYFQFFRGLHPDYQELSARNQRHFKRQCLSFLHELLDKEDVSRDVVSEGDPMNLSNSHASDEEDVKPCVVNGVYSVRDEAEGAAEPD
ncbi:uncharacterized protein LOC106139608 isoform X3 [Amyelois transitella]|uniref:uncharacterized protein LOC106139608 isoform X3 n=1 Tax=Amyelois transitella TaxID=680683 RepID=UPI00067B6380|nr:uncharacterized protein LOC106139608 isoform X3 [Amyelois transitella]XP_060804837.1 uncharacterized protein LOC106139608 isoform X3 [Amyelois transitella]XP_060804838.1 uncharacterized protein LOC106139608 isoform X3 [Amyelois transitella]XP_060804839.1 uncharacterized protein LOC106139608 isoform X3 [Amyelois transitella]